MTQDNGMGLSIIIVSWNTRDLLKQCLDSVAANPPDCTYDVWVVDNASADGSAAMVCERFPQVHLIENTENVGFARANNQGIRKSSGKYLQLLNPDTVVGAGMFREMTHFLDAYASAGICGALAFNPDGSYQAGGNLLPTLRSEVRQLVGREIRPPTARLGKEPQETGWVGGACLLMRRSVLEQIGLLDERFYMYCEETDLCWRAKRKGWANFIVPSAKYTHYGAQSTRQVRRRMLRHLYASKALLLRKHCGTLHAGIYGALAIGVYAAKSLWARKTALR